MQIRVTDRSPNTPNDAEAVVSTNSGFSATIAVACAVASAEEFKNPLVTADTTASSPVIQLVSNKAVTKSQEMQI